jgi:hypothetical protein
MIKYKIYLVIMMLLVSAGFNSQVIASDILTNSRYTDLRSDFLNINPNLFFEIDIAGMTPAERDSFIQGSAESELTIKETDSPDSQNLSQYGAAHSCINDFGDDAVCWYATGGSKGNFSNGACGQPIEGDYTTAEATTGKHCGSNEVWSGIRMWLGAQSRTNFLVDNFPGASDNPVNRLCVEWTLPGQANMDMDYNNRGDGATSLPSGGTLLLHEARPEYSQLVNHSGSAPHLRDILYEWGTYTSPRLDDQGATISPEEGRTYQLGGSHFYHKYTAYFTVPPDRSYAVDSNTHVMCMGNIPSSTRSGMRPVYIANPLLTLGGEDENGISTAPSYMNHLTRVYFDLGLGVAKVNYPFNMTLNKIWMMYEENDIFLADRDGGTLGVDLVTQGDSAVYPIILFNNAITDRTYRLFMAMGDRQHRYKDSDDFQLFIDSNANKVLDEEELSSTLIPANSIFSVPAKSSQHYILVHTPNFTSGGERHGKKYHQGTISFVEEGRLRSASYAVRTWEATTSDDIANKSQWISNTQYPSENSDWNRYREFNMEKDIETNPHLIRNTPDFNTAEGLKPKSPINLLIDQ